MTFSFVKDVNVVVKKWPKMVAKWPFIGYKFPGVFLTKLKIKGSKTNCELCPRF